MRLWLALQTFFAILFSGRAPEPVRALLPPPPDEGASSEASGGSSDDPPAGPSAEDLEAARAAEAEACKRAEAAEGKLEEAEARLETAQAAKTEAEGKLGEARDAGALSLLAWLQREGRLIDFLTESVGDYDDAQVGQAVRAVHAGCLKVLNEALSLEPVLEGEEESPVTVPAGFDPVAIQLSGNVKGEPPFKGTLIHPGWKTAKVHVPVSETVDPRVLAPAEVEL